MAFPNPAARNQYLKTQVETASKEQLVVMLFDGIIRFTEQARKAIENKEIENSHNALMRAQAIVMELIVTVDKEKGGEVAQNLMALHAYSFNCLVKCNLHKDISKIDEVQGIYRKLREGWVGAMESLGIAPNGVRAAAPGAQAPAAPAAGKPVPPVGGRPLPTGAAPKAPAAPARPAGTPPAPQQPGIGGGILAAKPGMPATARPAAAPIAPAARPAAPAPAAAAAAAKPVTGAPAAPAATPTPAAPAAPRPAMPAAGGYGMGRTAAMMGAYAAKPAIPTAGAAGTTGAAATAPKQNPVLGAYQQQAGTRSIA